MSFQSRFGTAEWLQPYTDRTVEALAKSGVKRLAMVAPGFSADCLETLEELDVENREIFSTTAASTSRTCPALTTARTDAGHPQPGRAGNVGLVEGTRRLRTERGVSGALRGPGSSAAQRAPENDAL